MMINDNERREVARRMREPFDVIWQGRYVAPSLTLFGMHLIANSESELRAGVARLADLVETEPERTCGNYGGEEGTNGEYYDFACTECGFCCDLPQPSFCPACGAKVVYE